MLIDEIRNEELNELLYRIRNSAFDLGNKLYLVRVPVAALESEDIIVDSNKFISRLYNMDILYSGLPEVIEVEYDLINKESKRADKFKEKTLKAKVNKEINKKLRYSEKKSKMIPDSSDVVYYTHNDFKEVMLTIEKILDIYLSGFTIRIVEKNDVFEIYEKIKKVLKELSYGVNIRNEELKSKLEMFIEEILEVQNDNIVRKEEEKIEKNLLGIKSKLLFKTNRIDKFDKSNLSLDLVKKD